MPEPTVAALSAIASAVNAAVTLGRFIFELKNTPVDVKTCLDLVARVDEDIQYAISLRAKHLKLLSTTPDELRRLDRIVARACESILDVGRLLEGCRKEAHGGQVPMKGRMKWVLGDSNAFLRRTANLQQQHAAINVEIAFLRQLEALGPLRDLATNITIDNSDLIYKDMPPPPDYSRSLRQSLVQENDICGSAIDPNVHKITAQHASMILHRDSYLDPGQGVLAVSQIDEGKDPAVAFYREMKQKAE